MDTNKLVMDTDNGQILEVVWDGTQRRPNSHTKGELLGQYDCGESVSAIVHIYRSHRRQPRDDGHENR